MFRHLAIRLNNGGTIAFGTALPEDAAPFDGLGELLCMDISDGEPETADAELVPPDAMPEGRHILRNTPLTESAYPADWSRVLIAGWKRQPQTPHLYHCVVWQTMLVYAGLNAVLRGENAVPAHCAVLESDRGAILLFGESGIGKSTAFGRWRADGGRGCSDDMALLDFSGEDGIRVRRLPTWSACRENRNEWNYPAGEELPLTGLLALGRSETGRDGITDLSAAQFFAQCYRSLFYWFFYYAGHLPDDLKGRLADRIRRMTETITGRYAARALLTVPSGGGLAELIEAEL